MLRGSADQGGEKKIPSIYSSFSSHNKMESQSQDKTHSTTLERSNKQWLNKHIPHRPL